MDYFTIACVRCTDVCVCVTEPTAESDLTFVRTFVLFVSLERNESRRASFFTEPS